MFETYSITKKFFAFAAGYVLGCLTWPTLFVFLTLFKGVDAFQSGVLIGELFFVFAMLLGLSAGIIMFITYCLQRDCSTKRKILNVIFAILLGSVLTKFYIPFFFRQPVNVSEITAPAYIFAIALWVLFFHQKWVEQKV